MAKSPFSPNWYRVAPLRPRLRGHVEIHDHIYRGVTWRIVEDRQTGRYHRLSPAAYYFVCMMDGSRTIEDIWDLTERRFGRDTPTQDEAIRLLAQLHNADLVVGGDLPDLSEIDRRAREIGRRTIMARVKNPMALRIPVFDPDRFIVATLPLVGWLFSPVGALLWLVLVVAGGVQAALHWPELTGNLSDRILSGQNLVLIALVYPVIKTIHEFAHAYAVRRWGGEVHEMGLMFLVLLPVPYVDASASVAFREWTRRATVAGAGIFAELAVAAAAILIWTQVEPGVVRAALFNVALIGGVSTLLFNGNPLLRFDGYYMLTDMIGIPNLGTRANKYLGYLVQRYVFGLESAESPVVARGERLWFVVYAIAAFLYRVTVMMAISLFIATKFFFVGILLALLVVLNMLVMPVFKGLSFVLTAPALQAHRIRAVAITGFVLLFLAGSIGFVPLPRTTMAEAVVWPPEGSIVRAGTAGEVAEVLVRNGAMVEQGTIIYRLRDTRLEAQIGLVAAQLKGLNARRTEALAMDPGSVRFVETEIGAAQDEMAQLEERRGMLAVRAPRSGRWAETAGPDMQGEFVGRGDKLGQVLQSSDDRMRAVVTQAEVDLIRSRTVAASARLVHAPEREMPVEVAREVPAGDRQLPSPALTVAGGGTFATDPSSRDGLQTLEPVFQFELRLLEPPDDAQGRLYSGERAYVRFVHGNEPLYRRFYSAGRRLFLSVLDV